MNSTAPANWAKQFKLFYNLILTLGRNYLLLFLLLFQIIMCNITLCEITSSFKCLEGNVSLAFPVTQ